MTLVEPAEYITNGGCAPLLLGQARAAASIASAIKDLKKGERADFVIQPECGYGEAGCDGPAVPPNAVLRAEIELVDIIEVILPHHETFSTIIQPPYSSTKG